MSMYYSQGLGLYLFPKTGSSNDGGGIGSVLPLTLKPDEGFVGVNNTNPTAAMDVNGNIKITGCNYIEFASDVNKGVNAGMITMGRFTSNTLEILGVEENYNPTDGYQRQVKIWDDLEVTGSLFISGKESHLANRWYEPFTHLDIVGAGVAGSGNRKVRIWDDLTVQSDLTVQGNFTTQGSLTIPTLNAYSIIGTGTDGDGSRLLRIYDNAIVGGTLVATNLNGLGTVTGTNINSLQNITTGQNVTAGQNLIAGSYVTAKCGSIGHQITLHWGYADVNEGSVFGLGKEPGQDRDSDGYASMFAGGLSGWNGHLTIVGESVIYTQARIVARICGTSSTVILTHADLQVVGRTLGGSWDIVFTEVYSAQCSGKSFGYMTSISPWFVIHPNPALYWWGELGIRVLVSPISDPLRIGPVYIEFR